MVRILINLGIAAKGAIWAPIHGAPFRTKKERGGAREPLEPAGNRCAHRGRNTANASAHMERAGKLGSARRPPTIKTATRLRETQRTTKGLAAAKGAQCSAKGGRGLA